MDPAITEVMNAAAPTSSPIAMLELFTRARNVTPARLSLKCKEWAIVLRLTEKKSPATKSRVVNRTVSHARRWNHCKGFGYGKSAIV